MSQSSIHQPSSIAAYFHEAVTEALRNQGVEASEHAEFYLVNLLSEFSFSPVTDQSLTLLLAEAQAAQPAERVQKLRTVGDHSLYLTGFFQRALERRAVDRRYYIALGGSAYQALSGVLERPMGQTYRELSQKFHDFVDVLAEVSAQALSSTPSGMLDLYERYLRTGSDWSERRLRALGLGVVPARGKANA